MDLQYVYYDKKIFMHFYDDEGALLCISTIRNCDREWVQRKPSWKARKQMYGNEVFWIIESNDGILLGDWLLGVEKGDGHGVFYKDGDSLNNLHDNISRIPFDEVEMNV